jgi:hypothetical protein
MGAVKEAMLEADADLLAEEDFYFQFAAGLVRATGDRVTIQRVIRGAVDDEQDAPQI